MRIYLLFVLTVIILSCNSQNKLNILWCKENDSTIKKHNMSFRELYKLKDLQGKTIMITGYFSYNFEDVALYPDTKADQEGIWLNFSHELLKSDSLLKKINKKKIAITGQVDLTNKGHLNYYFCSLYNITCIRQ